MSVWDVDKAEEERRKEAGIDWDVTWCLANNEQPFTVADIEKVVAVFEGSNDGDDWRWIIQLTQDAAEKHGAGFVFMQGGCDYTGWDCQSWAKSSFAKTALEAAEFAKTGPEGATVQEAVIGMGMGRLLGAFSGEYMHNTDPVYDELVKQIQSTKQQTWREKKDEEFGTSDLPKIG